MSIRSQLGRAQGSIISAFYRCTVPLGNAGPIVSFTFDDFPRTACSMGSAILEESGARGTYYAAVGLMNSSNHLGEMFVKDDVHALLEKGHEIGSHTFAHSSGRSTPLRAFEADVQEGIKTVEDFTGRSATNFAYPFGHVTLGTKKILAGRVTSARSIMPGFNGPEVDLNFLRAHSLYGGIEQARRAEELILENKKRKSWLIFYTHDVSHNPSLYGCTPALLERTVFTAAKNSRILTIQDALFELKAGMPVKQTEAAMQVEDSAG